MQVRDRQVYVNDQPLHEPYVHYTATFGKSRAPLDQSWCPKRVIALRSVVTSAYISTENLCLSRRIHTTVGLFQPRNDNVTHDGS